ncbi:MAG: PAS domain S-box protein [Candidatus Kariarchaeaceae archaeon]|jgi:PAS domain S-box-containing protein
MHTNTSKKNISLFNLKDSEEKYRLLVENLSDAIVISHNERFIYFNKQFADMLGYEPEELMLKDYREVYSKKSIKILNKRQAKRKRGEKVPSRYETVFIRKGGREVLIEANVAIFNYHGSKATFAVIRDITEQKNAEKKLAESEKLYRMLFELSPTGILLENLDGSILDANPAFCNSVGYSEEELIGKNVNILVHPDALGQVSENIRQLKKGKILKHQEKSLRKDGLICYMDLHESKISLPDGTEGILCIANDVTEKRKAEEDRIKRERMEGVLELAGAVCHELNQPMTVVSVNSEIITPDMDKEVITGKMETIKKEIRKMGKITRKLMHITRYETREYLNGRKILDIDKSISD